MAKRKPTNPKSTRAKSRSKKPTTMFGRFKALSFKQKLAPIGITVFGLIALAGLGTYAYNSLLWTATASGCTKSVYKRGSTGNCVGYIQQIINSSGLATKLTVDKSFGPATLKSVQSFQKAKKLTVDGVVGANTWKALCAVTQASAATPKKSAGCPQTVNNIPKAAPTVVQQCTRSTFKRGSTGTCVGYIQQIINSSGLATKLTVDKSFGPATLKSVESFQKAKKLTADGVVGPNTWYHLCGIGGIHATNAGCSLYRPPKPAANPSSGGISVPSTARENAQAILKNSRITISSKYRYQISDYANGKANCPLQTDLLKLINHLGKSYTFTVSSLNRQCTNTKEGDYLNSHHWYGYAFDVSQVNGVKSTGGTSTDLAFIKSAASSGLLRSVGQSQCRGSLNLPSSVRQHTDTCHHIHLSVLHKAGRP